MNIDVAKKDKRKALLGAVALALVVAVLAPPAVEAATQKVKTVKGSVVKASGTVTSKLRDTGGGVVNSQAIEDQGLFGAEGSSGALDVRTFAGGNGFLGAGDCNGPGLPPTATAAGGSIITGLIITGVATVEVSTAALPPAANPVLTFQTEAGNLNESIALGNGIRATAPLDFNCTSGTGNFVIIGQDN
ncbi:MAG: hypothetical protein ACRDJB_13555 [Actinomycetota bacterium]